MVGTINPPGRKSLLRKLRDGTTTPEENRLIIKQGGEIIDHCEKRCKQIFVLYIVFAVGIGAYAVLMAP